jgi:hypothetical protein
MHACYLLLNHAVNSLKCLTLVQWHAEIKHHLTDVVHLSFELLLFNAQI